MVKTSPLGFAKRKYLRPPANDTTKREQTKHAPNRNRRQQKRFTEW